MAKSDFRHLAQNGTTPADQVRLMIQYALKRAEDHDRWFREQVQEGIAAAERGEFVEHENVDRMLDDRYRS